MAISLLLAAAPVSGCRVGTREDQATRPVRQGESLTWFHRPLQIFRNRGQAGLAGARDAADARSRSFSLARYPETGKPNEIGSAGVPPFRIQTRNC